MVVGLASPALNRPPDLLVSGDARLIALRTPQGIFLQQGKGVSKFTLQAWSQYLAVDAFQPVADNPAAGIRCEPGACLLRPYADRPGALLARGAQHPDWCGQVSVIVSAEPARGLCPRPWPALVDRFTVWRSGSAAIWLERDGARIVADRTDRGDRPWVPPVPKPRPPPPSKLPPAAVDEGTQPGTDASAEDPSAGE